MHSDLLATRPRVLLVEDSLPIRQRLNSLITESGLACVVGEASSVKLALSEFERVAPDAVVLVLQLADGSGYTVLEAIKFVQPDCLVIVMTNFAAPEARTHCLRLGADHFLEKSTDFELVPALLAARSDSVLPATPAVVDGVERLVAEGLAAMPREADLHYRHLVESVAAAVYTCDAQGHINFYNEAAAELWGREPALGHERWCGSWRIYHPDGRPLPLDECPMAQAIRHGCAVRGAEILVERPDGSRWNILPHPQPLFDASGAVIGAVNLLVDITALRSAEVARKRAQLAAQATLDGLATHISVLDARGEILSVNDAWRRFGDENHGDPLRINEGANYLDVCDQAVSAGAPGAAEFAGGLRAVLAGALPSFELEYPCHAGVAQRWFMARVTPMRGDGPPCVIVGQENITTRKLAEIALLDSLERWKFAVEGSGDGIWDFDLVRGRTTYSRRWKAMLGYADEDISDSPEEWRSRIHPDDVNRALAADKTCRDGKMPIFHCEFRMRCKDGSWKWVLDRGMVATRASDGRPLRMVGTHSDIDERKHAEAARAALELQLREAQKMEVVGTLASSIAHDFNNIMGAVLGNVALARQVLGHGQAAAQ